MGSKKVKDDYKDLYWLECQYYDLGKTIQDIAEEQGVSMITIRKWLDMSEEERQKLLKKPTVRSHTKSRGVEIDRGINVVLLVVGTVLIVFFGFIYFSMGVEVLNDLFAYIFDFFQIEMGDIVPFLVGIPIVLFLLLASWYLKHLINSWRLPKSTDPFWSQGNVAEGVERVKEKDDYKNLKWLRNQYYELGTTIQDIANNQGVSMITIRKWIDKLEGS